MEIDFINPYDTMEKSISKITAKCTFGETGKKYPIQKWRWCKTCQPERNHTCVCISCCDICHKGHELGPIETSACFCDCGAARLENYHKCSLLGKRVSTTIAIAATFEPGFAVSPHSIYMAIETLSLIRPSVRTIVMNFIRFPCSRVLSQYLSIHTGVYGTKFVDVKKANFNIEQNEELNVDKLNKYWEKKTGGAVVEAVSSDMILPNCLKVLSILYIKIKWVHCFDKALTTETKFKGTFGTRNVQMMIHRGNKRSDCRHFIQTKHMHSLCLYATDFVVIFTLPKKKECKELFTKYSAEYESHLNMKGIEKYNNCQVRLPKFKVSTYRNILDNLIDASLDAKFQMLSGIESVIQSASFEIDEYGAEGRSTIIMLTRGELASYDTSWIGDRPFAFAVNHLKSKTTVFLGVFDFTVAKKPEPKKYAVGDYEYTVVKKIGGDFSWETLSSTGKKHDNNEDFLDFVLALMKKNTITIRIVTIRDTNDDNFNIYPSSVKQYLLDKGWTSLKIDYSYLLLHLNRKI